MNECSIKDFFNVLVLKNQLITLNSYEMKELYQDYSNYIIFLDTFCVLTSIDSGFLFLNDDIVDKIEKVVNYNRFNTDFYTYEIINKIIQYLNLIKGYSSEQRNLYQKSYLVYQEDIRKVQINNIDELLQYLTYDARMVIAIEDDNTEIIDDDKMFMSSLNYLIETAPEVFQNPLVYKFMKERLNSIKIKPMSFSFKTKKLIKDTRNNYQRIKQKEE